MVISGESWMPVNGTYRSTCVCNERQRNRVEGIQVLLSKRKLACFLAEDEDMDEFFDHWVRIRNIVALTPCQ